MTRSVQVGCVPVGGGAPISIQSMTNTDTRDIAATSEQIRRLDAAGCEIIRMSVYDAACAQAIETYKQVTRRPLVADIHFDHRLAIAAAEHGVDKLRINPGNIGGMDKVRRVCDCAKAHHLPIRVGVNSGSVERDLLDKYGGPTPEAMVESALNHVRLLEQAGFSDTIISLKASNVPNTLAAYQLIARQVDYPLHVGVTEAGMDLSGVVKSAIGIGALLAQGIGDTIRVSLTGDPVPEVSAALEILRALGLRASGVNIVSCPTCGRTQVPVEQWVRQLKARTAHITTPLTVAVMGCVVNGPGESREADLGVAGGKDKGAIFAKGKLVATLPAEGILDALMERIEAEVAAREGRV